MKSACRHVLASALTYSSATARRRTPKRPNGVSIVRHSNNSRPTDIRRRRARHGRSRSVFPPGARHQPRQIEYDHPISRGGEAANLTISLRMILDSNIRPPRAQKGDRGG